MTCFPVGLLVCWSVSVTFQFVVFDDVLLGLMPLQNQTHINLFNRVYYNIFLLKCQ